MHSIAKLLTAEAGAFLKIMSMSLDAQFAEEQIVLHAR
jgi:hypothetical protein